MGFVIQNLSYLGECGGGDGNTELDKGDRHRHQEVGNHLFLRYNFALHC